MRRYEIVLKICLAGGNPSTFGESKNHVFEPMVDKPHTRLLAGKKNFSAGDFEFNLLPGNNELARFSARRDCRCLNGEHGRSVDVYLGGTSG